MDKKVNPLSQSFSLRGLVRVTYTGLLGGALFSFGATVHSATPVLGYRVVAQYPHGTDQFTEGLELNGGNLYESAGGYGKSDVSIRRLNDARLIRHTPLPASVFGEGLTVWADQIYVLTWREGIGMIFDRSLKPLRRFSVPREGWGLTHLPTLGGERLLMSDGSSTLFELDPDSLRDTGTIDVTDSGRPVERLNELEYAKGDIYANVWMTPNIAVIQPGTGHVRAWLDFSTLADRFQKPPGWNPEEHVLNGIAFDGATGHLLITGKCWPILFEIAVEDR